MVFTPPTDLMLHGIDIPPYSARGLTQTLEPIDAAANVVRAIDGSLLDLSYEPFQKYKSTISGTDQDPPAVDGVWGGRVVTVYCIQRLSFHEYGSPQRPAVPGSLVLANGFWFYRPILVMRVMSFNVQTNEWGAEVSWTMELEED
jgi:hypothetical protein